MIRFLILTTLALSLSATPAHTQTAADSTAIRQTALDYIEGWYTADANRMSQAVHTKLVKRIFATHPKTGRQVFRDQDSTALVAATEKGYGTRTPESKRRADVTVLDVFEGAASVKIDAAGWVDYLHLAKEGGEWQIVNVLWEMKSKRGKSGS
jgi:hypothetical protein